MRHTYEYYAARMLAARGEGEAIPACDPTAVETSHWGLRIGSIFVILAGSLLGALLPVALARTSQMKVPRIGFFIAKYFGSGVILATAWMHLLSPANEQLGDPCVAGIMGDYDWAPCIALMTIMVMFFVELMIARFNEKNVHGKASHSHGIDSIGTKSPADVESGSKTGSLKEAGQSGPGTSRIPGGETEISYPPGGENHLAHQHDHYEGDSYADYAAQLTGLFILEFGIIFHSIFIGLTLAITDGFVILFVVLIFHQTFEGLGLGSRLATMKWPSDARRWTPWVMGCLYGVTTPIAIAVGLGVKESLADNPARTIVTNGVFDAISAGILVYTALVELLAHEFMFNPEMRKAPISMQLSAYLCVAVGVALMSLLAKWA